MKIVYLIHSLHSPGGMERVLSVKASYLAGLPGYSVHIVTASLRGRKPFFPLSDKVELIDLGTGDSPFGMPAYRRRLAAELERLRPDVCISLGGHDITALPGLRDDSVKIAEFHFPHDKFYRKYGSNPVGRLYARLRTHKFEAAAAQLQRLVVLTAKDAEAWAPRLQNVTVIGNPVAFPSDISTAPAALDAKSMIAVGRLSPQKNIPAMVRAWSLVAAKHPDWSLDIFGAGPMKDGIERLVGQCGLAGKVRLMGLSTDIRSEMLSRSGIVMSSVYEGFPLALVEASSCGLPMVSFECSGSSEIIADGRNGFMVAQGDEKGLSDAICRLIDDAELRRAMGRTALESSSRFGIDAVMRRWTELFESLTGKI